MPLRSRSALLGALLCASALIPATASAATVDGAWKTVASPLDRNDATATTLPNGDVLVAGGQTSSHTASASASLYDHTADVWKTVAPMHAARWRASAALLPGGHVLVAGGAAGAEVYDPATDSWTDTGAPVRTPDLSSATTLADGRVLVVGGQGSPTTAQVYDPATNAWTATGPVRTVRSQSPAIARRADGRVLVAGGYNANGGPGTAEIYTPATNAWTDASPMPEGLLQPYAATLPDGRVVVAGGNAFVGGVPYESKRSSVYDPASDTWTPTGDLPVPAGEGASIVTLKDGRPLLLGGYWWTNVDAEGGHWSGSRDETATEVFDPATLTWIPTGALAHGRAGAAVALVGDGDVLATGGWDSGASTERFTLGAVPKTDPPVVTRAVTPTPPVVARPKPPVVVSDPAAAPKFPKDLKTLKVGKTGKVAVKLTCSPGLGSCRGTLKLTTRAKHPKTLASAAFRMTTGRSTTVTLKLSAAIRKQLHKHHTLKAQLTLGKRTVLVTVRGS